MNRNTFERQGSGRRRKRTAAACLLALMLLTAVGTAAAARNPLEPLRALTRVTLAAHGARFVADGRVTFQSSLNDCGSAALADFLELSGVQAPSQATLRRLASISPSGTTLRNLERAAGGLGLRALAVRWDPAELSVLPLPSIVWVDHRHFVVVRRILDDSVDVNDPAAGRYRMATDRFARLWTGEALIPLDSVSPHRRSDH